MTTTNNTRTYTKEVDMNCKADIDLSLEELLLLSDSLRYTTICMGPKAVTTYVRMSSLLDKVEHSIYEIKESP